MLSRCGWNSINYLLQLLLCVANCSSPALPSQNRMKWGKLHSIRLLRLLALLLFCWRHRQIPTIICLVRLPTRHLCSPVFDGTEVALALHTSSYKACKNWIQMCWNDKQVYNKTSKWNVHSICMEYAWRMLCAKMHRRPNYATGEHFNKCHSYEIFN